MNKAKKNKQYSPGFRENNFFFFFQRKLFDQRRKSRSYKRTIFNDPHKKMTKHIHINNNEKSQKPKIKKKMVWWLCVCYN